MTLHERCLAYAKAFPQWPDSWPRVTPSGRYVYAHWVIGALFKNETRYYGAYPRTYPERVRALFPDVRDRELLHVFAGAVQKGTYRRLDVKPELRTELVGSVYDLPALLGASPRPRLVLADPPYTKRDAAKYGTPPLDKARAMRSIAAAVDPGAQLVWLDTCVPIYRADQWINWGSITVVRSTNQAVREASFFERRAA